MMMMETMITTNWYSKVTHNLAVLPDFLEHYEGELLVARKESGIYGNIENNLKQLPAKSSTWDRGDTNPEQSDRSP